MTVVASDTYSIRKRLRPRDMKQLLTSYSYKDMLKDEWANDQAYDFWKRSVRARVKNPQKAKVLAPDVKPHPFGTKRNSLEVRFYEVMDQDHVDIVDVNTDPIEEVTPEGIRTKDKFVEADVSSLPRLVWFSNLVR